MKIAILIAAGLVLLLLFGGSFAAMCFACLHARWLTSNADRAIQHSSLRRYAKELSAGFQWIAAQPSETVTIKAFDGVRLVGRYLPCDKARGTLLLFHGWRSLPEIDFGCALPFYQSLGLNLLLVNERAHGASGGRFITFGIRERRDVHRWVEWHNARFGAETPVLLGGLSMGAATVLMSCGEPFPANVRGVVADCGFTSPQDILSKIAREHHIPQWFLPFVSLQTRLFAGFGLKEYSTLTALGSCRLPLLLIHGEADAFVPCEMSRRAFAASAAEDKTLMTVPNAGHGQSYLLEGDRYRRTVADFVARVLPPIEAAQKGATQ